MANKKGPTYPEFKNWVRMQTGYDGISFAELCKKFDVSTGVMAGWMARLQKELEADG